MTRQFSIPTVIRMVPNVLLKEFFERLGHGEFDPCWGKLGSHEIDPIVKYIADLPATQSNAIEMELRNIYELSCDSGMSAIIESAKIEGQLELALQMPIDLSVHGRSMWIRLR